ncbi:hypothetical protein [Brevibacterium otitidis]|uniref:Uncharacterized protein n=1 Tax=Brevibacterium otitidis TaxID=53364 RepID=A0ABV5X458_9MICO|nr:hypothetical protein GCM10023233_08920 [Brevibacterium otitidis]
MNDSGAQPNSPKPSSSPKPSPAAAAGALETAAWQEAVEALEHADDATALEQSGRLLDELEQGLSSL